MKRGRIAISNHSPGTEGAHLTFWQPIRLLSLAPSLSWVFSDGRQDNRFRGLRVGNRSSGSTRVSRISTQLKLGANENLNPAVPEIERRSGEERVTDASDLVAGATRREVITVNSKLWLPRSWRLKILFGQNHAEIGRAHV